MKNYILDEREKPTPALLQLLQLCEVPHENTLESIIVQTQIKWCQLGKERWELEERYPEKKAEALTLLKKLGCIDAVHPSQSHYTYGILLGASRAGMQSRIETLIEEWKKGVRFDTLILLTGKRPLTAWENPTETLQTEADLFLDLLEHADLPQELKNSPRILINTPMQIAKGGAVRRPNAADTIMAWLDEYHPTPGPCLIFANQPFVGYFEAVFKIFLPDTFAYEVVGKKANENAQLALFLDNLARWLYQVSMALLHKSEKITTERTENTEMSK
ncbi:MAG: hypothetical protein ACHQT8_03270 [Chlamydiales bacterium]